MNEEQQESIACLEHEQAEKAVKNFFSWLVMMAFPILGSIIMFNNNQIPFDQLLMAIFGFGSMPLVAAAVFIYEGKLLGLNWRNVFENTCDIIFEKIFLR